MQYNTDVAERVVCDQSRQLQLYERNYPVHDKKFLAMKYALAKFRVYLLGDRPFIVYTDHASLRTAVNIPHLSQRMARWLSLLAEYNFSVEYKPGRLKSSLMLCRAGPISNRLRNLTLVRPLSRC